MWLLLIGLLVLEFLTGVVSALLSWGVFILLLVLTVFWLGGWPLYEPGSQRRPRPEE